MEDIISDLKSELQYAEDNGHRHVDVPTPALRKVIELATQVQPKADKTQDVDGDNFLRMFADDVIDCCYSSYDEVCADDKKLSQLFMKYTNILKGIPILIPIDKATIENIFEQIEGTIYEYGGRQPENCKKECLSILSSLGIQSQPKISRKEIEDFVERITEHDTDLGQDDLLNILNIFCVQRGLLSG